MIQKTTNGLKLLVYVQPNSSKSEICGFHDNALKIKLKAPATDGLANKALIDFLAEKLNISKKHIEFEFGEKSRKKLLLIECSMDEAALRNLLDL